MSVRNFIALRHMRLLSPDLRLNPKNSAVGARRLVACAKRTTYDYASAVCHRRLELILAFADL